MGANMDNPDPVKCVRITIMTVYADGTSVITDIRDPLRNPETSIEDNRLPIYSALDPYSPAPYATEARATISVDLGENSSMVVITPLPTAEKT